jgi:SAM-dependent methyltransferase|tara:strand:- start:4624 stop:5391 length:768 start_codon:yes stop_codon:yes gene_type:complete
MLKDLSCSICAGTSMPHDVVDFNKSCEENNGKFLRPSGVSIYYYLCHHCGFCFAPEICDWPSEKFSKEIYNSQYIDIDPDYKENRPKNNAAHLSKIFNGKTEHIRHLDFGGGNGSLSDALKGFSWDSQSYDPFMHKDINITDLGRFNLITAYEVFEHVPDANALMEQLNSLISSDGVILFSTLLSDGQIKPNTRLNWWYAAPRNGHISLFSKKSLQTLANKYNFEIGSLSSGTHILYRKVPDWAAHLFNQGKKTN